MTIGAAGGLAAFLGVTGGRTVETVLAGAPDSSGELPAPVTSVAQQAVDAWLTAEGPDDERLDRLFVEPPDPRQDGGPLVVDQIVPISGGRWEQGYWLVVLAVEVYECVEVTAAGDDDSGSHDRGLSAGAAPIDCDRAAVADRAEGEGPGGPAGPGGEPVYEPRQSTWFIEVGVVGELNRRVAALTTPAVVAPPAAVSDAWQSAARDAAPPAAGEPVATTVAEFLRGWLAAGGDLDRYLAPGVEVQPIDPAPFVDLEIVSIAYQEIEPGHVRTLAHVAALTPGGSQLTVGYEVELKHREDRWEVSAHWGAPTLAGRPSSGPAGD